MKLCLAVVFLISTCAMGSMMSFSEQVFEEMRQFEITFVGMTEETIPWNEGRAMLDENLENINVLLVAMMQEVSTPREGQTVLALSSTYYAAALVVKSLSVMEIQAISAAPYILDIGAELLTK